MFANGSLVLTGEEAETVGDFPFLDGAGHVGEEPDHQRHYHNARCYLGGPLDDLDVPPDRDALVG